MWTVVFVSKDEAKIKNITSLLNKNGILTMNRKSAEDDFGGTTYEILVPQTELETAQDIIVDIEL